MMPPPTHPKQAKRPEGLIGTYDPDGPVRPPEFYVAVAQLEDGREHVCVVDGRPLVAGGGAALRDLYAAASTFADITGNTVTVLRYTAPEVARVVKP